LGYVIQLYMRLFHHYRHLRQSLWPYYTALAETEANSKYYYMVIVLIELYSYYTD